MNSGIHRVGIKHIVSKIYHRSKDMFFSALFDFDSSFLNCISVATTENRNEVKREKTREEDQALIWFLKA